MPTISVAMATCNGARFLNEQLESLRNQTRPPEELVIFDDASEDQTLAEARAFARNAPFPVHLHARDHRVGYERNFMEAAGLCTAELIAFCDQDDVWHESKLLRVEQEFAAGDLLMLYHNAFVVDAALSGSHRLYREQTGSRTWQPMSRNPWSYPLGFTQVFSRDLLNLSELHHHTIGLFSNGRRLGHDYWIAFLASTLGRVRYLDEPLAYYRQHGANTFGQSVGQTSRHLGSLDALVNLRQPEFDSLIGFCKGYASILADVQHMDHLPSTFHSNSETASRGFKRLGELYAERRDVYRREGFARRLSSFLRLASRHNYGRSPDWSFGWKAAGRDGLVGVLFGELSTKWGRKSAWGDGALRLTSSAS